VVLRYDCFQNQTWRAELVGGWIALLAMQEQRRDRMLELAVLVVLQQPLLVAVEKVMVAGWWIERSNERTQMLRRPNSRLWLVLALVLEAPGTWLG